MSNSGDVMRPSAAHGLGRIGSISAVVQPESLPVKLPGDSQLAFHRYVYQNVFSLSLARDIGSFLHGAAWPL